MNSECISGFEYRLLSIARRSGKQMISDMPMQTRIDEIVRRLKPVQLLPACYACQLISERASAAHPRCFKKGSLFTAGPKFKELFEKSVRRKIEEWPCSIISCQFWS